MAMLSRERTSEKLKVGGHLGFLNEFSIQKVVLALPSL